jgi:hypothetical protein
MSLNRQIIFGLFIISSVCLAQPHYPNNFAGSTYNAQIKEADKHPSGPELKRTEEDEDEEEKPDVAPAKTSTAAVTETSKSVVPVEENGTDVLSIGGYIDARDAQHFENSIKDLREVSAKYDLAIGEVYGVGNYGWLFNRPELVFTIIARNGKPRIAHSVPKDLTISSSPAWLVATKHGTIVLEGVGKLEDLFNADGRLVLARLNAAKPETVLPPATPTPSAAK